MIPTCIYCRKFWSCKKCGEHYSKIRSEIPETPTKETIQFDDQNRVIHGFTENEGLNKRIMAYTKLFCACPEKEVAL